MNWIDCIVKAKDLDRQENLLAWEWGDLAIAAVEVWPEEKTSNGKVPVEAPIRALIEQSGVSTSWKTILVRYYVCKAWPKSKRVAAAFTVHSALMGIPNRFVLIRPGMTKAEAMRVLDEIDGGSREASRRMSYIGDYTLGDGLNRIKTGLSFTRLGRRIIAAYGADTLTSIETESARHTLEAIIREAQEAIDLLDNRTLAHLGGAGGTKRGTKKREPALQESV